MTVSELIAKLSTLPQDALVVMSSDAEGNGYSPLDAVDVGLYEADTTYSGCWYPPDEGDEAGGAVLFGVGVVIVGVLEVGRRKG